MVHCSWLNNRENDDAYYMFQKNDDVYYMFRSYNNCYSSLEPVTDEEEVSTTK